MGYSKYGKGRTRAGHVVDIYRTDAGGQFPIHGAYKAGDEWIPMAWRVDGLINPAVTTNIDLVELDGVLIK